MVYLLSNDNNSMWFTRKGSYEASFIGNVVVSNLEDYLKDNKDVKVLEQHPAQVKVFN